MADLSDSESEFELRIVRSTTGSTDGFMTDSSSSMTGSEQLSASESLSSVSSKIIVDDGRRFILHEVLKFDNLAGLAIKYGVEVSDIKRANRISNELQMFALKYVRIPLPGSYPPSPALTASPPPPSQRKSANPGDAIETDSGSKGKRDMSAAMGMLRGYYGLHKDAIELDSFKTFSDNDYDGDTGSISFKRWSHRDNDSDGTTIIPESSDRSSGGTPSSGQENQNGGWDYEWSEIQENGRLNADWPRKRHDGPEQERRVAESISGSYGTSLFSKGPVKKTSQAQQVAAVVEDLARAHQDFYQPPKEAGTSRHVLEGSSSDSLVRRRSKPDDARSNDSSGKNQSTLARPQARSAASLSSGDWSGDSDPSCGFETTGSEKALKMFSSGRLSRKDFGDELGRPVTSIDSSRRGYSRQTTDDSSEEESKSTSSQQDVSYSVFAPESIASIAMLGGRVVEDFLSRLRKSASLTSIELGSAPPIRQSRAGGAVSNSEFSVLHEAMNSSGKLSSGSMQNRRLKVKAAID